MWRFIFSGFLIFLALKIRAQEVPHLAMIASKPKIALRSLALNYNLLRLSQNLVSRSKTSQEIQAELKFHERFFLVAAIGLAMTQRGKTYDYNSKGSYWRVGVDADMSKNPNSENVLGVGLRYAQANFEDQIIYLRSLQDQDGTPIAQKLAFSNPSLVAQWAELVFNMRVKIWKQFYLGYTLRYQFSLQIDKADNHLKPFDVPGYGKTTQSNSFGFDYYVGWRLNF